MSWSKDKLRALAVERGEAAAGIGPLLLAHERMRGRTEEDYPREQAAKQLEALLERQAGPLPSATAQEFGALKQLRAYAADKALSRAVAQSGPKAEPAPEKAAGQVERAAAPRDQERDRG